MFQILEIHNHKLCLKDDMEFITCSCFLIREQIHIRYIVRFCTFDFGTRFQEHIMCENDCPQRKDWKEKHQNSSMVIS